MEGKWSKNPITLKNHIDLGFDLGCCIPQATSVKLLTSSLPEPRACFENMSKDRYVAFWTQV